MARYKLFKECYSHRVCRAIDFMIVDALMLANPVYKFQESIFSPADYTNITDDILSHIENSKSYELQKSRDILKNVRTRDLYRCLSQKMVDDKNLVQKYVINLSTNDSTDHTSGNSISIKCEQILWYGTSRRGCDCWIPQFGLGIERQEPSRLRPIFQ